MNRSSDWENERFIFEKLKSTKIFKSWKKTQFDCQVGRCAWCGKPMQYRYTETDHVTPLYYGGNSEAKNMVLCCHKCNKNKSTSTRYKRPDWIKTNSYDDAVTAKYYKLVYEFFPKETDSPKFNIDPEFIAEQENLNNQRTTDDTRKTTNNSYDAQAETVLNMHYESEKRRKREKTRKMVTVLILAPIVIFTIIYMISLFGDNRNSYNPLRRQSSSNSSNNYSNKSSGSNSSANTATDEDRIRKNYTSLILSEYSKYHDYWVVKKGYSLPRDAEGCYKWNGCNLSFPLGNAEVPDGYTYSINSLADGTTFTQTGETPHATKNNIALYKKARCGTNGVVIGGSIPRNAAVVVRLSDNSYYCVQN